MAQPQSGECFRCSSTGLSPSSQPSKARLHRKHVVLSGFVSYGLKKNPASASYDYVSSYPKTEELARCTCSGDGESYGHAIGWMVREVVDALDLIEGKAASKDARRAAKVSIWAPIAACSLGKSNGRRVWCCVVLCWCCPVCLPACLHVCLDGQPQPRRAADARSGDLGSRVVPSLARDPPRAVVGPVSRRRRSGPRALQSTSIVQSALRDYYCGSPIQQTSHAPPVLSFSDNRVMV
jgi:hypothetical protein